LFKRLVCEKKKKASRRTCDPPEKGMGFNAKGESWVHKEKKAGFNPGGYGKTGGSI